MVVLLLTGAGAIWLLTNKPGNRLLPFIQSRSAPGLKNTAKENGHILFFNIMLRSSSLAAGSAKDGLAAGAAGQPAGKAKRPRVGIIAGHWGNDSGAICPDGLTEQAVNLVIARRVAKLLRAQDYRVDLLQEFDPRLHDYKADALISIHADSCEYINQDATGFKAARSVASDIPDTEDRLVDCLIDNYRTATHLGFNANSITPDMTSYHTFSEIAPTTPAAIIETGFLYLDRNILVEQPNRVAQGIAQGVACFIENR